MSKVVVLDFYANWCNPCKKLDPYLKDFENKYPSHEFKKIDIELIIDFPRGKTIFTIPRR